jgi:hypothetical protein
VYSEDPLNARDSDELVDFSENFRKKHGRDAQKYFFEAIRVMNDVEVKPININDIKDVIGIYERDKLPNIFTAIGYFSMCEEELVSEKNKKNFCRFDIYREMSNYTAPHCQHNFLKMLSYVLSPALPVLFLEV